MSDRRVLPAGLTCDRAIWEGDTMTRHRFRAALPTAALAAVLVTLMPAGAALASPGMGGGCGGCGGGGGGESHHRNRPKPDEVRDRAREGAAEKPGESGHGITIGSGGRRSEDLTGSIAQVGETEAQSRPPASPAPSPAPADPNIVAPVAPQPPAGTAEPPATTSPPQWEPMPDPGYDPGGEIGPGGATGGGSEG
jgi:hypothetical protein